MALHWRCTNRIKLEVDFDYERKRELTASLRYISRHTNNICLYAMTVLEWSKSAEKIT